MDSFVIIDTEIEELKVIRPREFRDCRGSFSETYNQRNFAELGIVLQFVQYNQSHSVSRGTIRGLHFQIPPVAQAKLVRVVRGAILDVAVDIRVGSPTYGRWAGRVLSSENREQCLIPHGFAHGFCTLEPDSIVLYQVTDYYSPAHERGIRWDDATLNIDWGVAPEQVVLSERDRNHPFLDQLPTYFHAKSAIVGGAA